MPRQKIILDTDIGDDIDDALALGLILTSPELELLAITTVFGNTTARSRQARTILRIAGGDHVRVPVAAGCGGVMASRGMRDQGTIAYLENRLPNQDGSCLPESELPAQDPRHGVDVIIDTLIAGAGDIIPVTIGALTNLAMAMVKEPRIVAKIPRIVAMLGEFRNGFAEWNVRCDPEAAALVMRSGIPVDLTPYHVGHVATFLPRHLQRLNTSTAPLAQVLSRAIGLWRGASDNFPSLYDPLAVATIIQPDLCTWKRGKVSVELQGETTYGYTTLLEDSASATASSNVGLHRVAWDVDRETALDFCLGRLAPI